MPQFCRQLKKLYCKLAPVLNRSQLVPFFRTWIDNSSEKKTAIRWDSGLSNLPMILEVTGEFAVLGYPFNFGVTSIKSRMFSNLNSSSISFLITSRRVRCTLLSRSSKLDKLTTLGESLMSVLNVPRTN